jgi:preprotein translocase subunit Sec63
MDLLDCYRVLELDPPVTDEQLKRAYRDLTKVWHPDRFGDDAALRRKAEAKLKEINTAYEALCAARAGEYQPYSRTTPEPEPEDPETVARQAMVRNRMYAIVFAVLAVFLLLRRPTVGGLLIALALLVVAVMFVRRMNPERRP